MISIRTYYVNVRLGRSVEDEGENEELVEKRKKRKERKEEDVVNLKDVAEENHVVN